MAEPPSGYLGASGGPSRWQQVGGAMWDLPSDSFVGPPSLQPVGDYAGPGANAKPPAMLDLMSGASCVHCKLQARGHESLHPVMALAPGHPFAAWFLLTVPLGVPGYASPWERETTETTTFYRLRVTARESFDGQAHTYVWRLVDLRCDGTLFPLQLGVWVD